MRFLVGKLVENFVFSSNSKFKRPWAHFLALKRQKTGLSAPSPQNAPRSSGLSASIPCASPYADENRFEFGIAVVMQQFQIQIKTFEFCLKKFTWGPVRRKHGGVDPHVSSGHPSSTLLRHIQWL
jgi:hypothetical protein